MKNTEAQLRLPLPGMESQGRGATGSYKTGDARRNRLEPHDRAFHDWYRFVLAFPAHLVRQYLDSFCVRDDQIVLDPFCGTGTTLVECKLRGVRAIGLEANPFAHFASSVKTNWSVDPSLLRSRAADIAQCTLDELHKQGIDDVSPGGAVSPADLRGLDPDAEKLLLGRSISPLPLHKTLVLLEHLKSHSREPYYGHAVLALASALVFKISNLHFGPEVGVGKPKDDVEVVASWLAEIEKIARDLNLTYGKSYPHCDVRLADARALDAVLEPSSVDAVITSPPYPNEKDYTRTTRLESVILGFVKNKADLRSLKKTLVRSNTRGIYTDDDDDTWLREHPEVNRIADEIEARRKHLGKTSGFERMYSRVTRLYFGGMARHLSALRSVLRPGAQLAYVVGDQASYLRVMIRTGTLLADIAQALGYEIVRTDLFRTRFSTSSKQHLREEVLVMRYKQ